MKHLNLKNLYKILPWIIVVLLLHPKGGTWAYLLGIRWLYIFLLSFFISLAISPLTIMIAKKFNLFDQPDERKLHKQPIPRIGGIAIYFGIVLTCIRNLRFSSELVGLLLSGSLIFFIGLIDDIKGLSATVRFVTQIIAGFIATLFGLTLTILPHGIPFEGFFEIIITILWLIGLTNTINFMDGLDGLAAGMAVVSSFTFFIISLFTGQIFLSIITSAICGACFAFLFYNWHPAKLFMGDSGATFLGFMLGGTAVLGSWAEGNPIVAMSVPLLVLSIPIYDLIYTTISRIKNKQVTNIIQWLEYTAKDHLHHRLLRIGFEHQQAVMIFIMISLLMFKGAQKT